MVFLSHAADQMKRPWYELIPYGDSILEPGEWFWFVYPYIPPVKEAEEAQTNAFGKAPADMPIRITFRARS